MCASGVSYYIVVLVYILILGDEESLLNSDQVEFNTYQHAKLPRRQIKPNQTKQETSSFRNLSYQTVLFTEDY